MRRTTEWSLKVDGRRTKAMARYSLVIAALTMIVVVPAPAQDMAVQDVLMEDEPWQVVAEGFRFTEGPTADERGVVYFTDIPNNRIHKFTLDGAVSVFAENTGGANGLKFGPDRLLYACQNAHRRIVAYDASGGSKTIVDDAPSNDIVVLRSGAIYFTDPDNHKVWRVGPDGQKKVVDEGLGFPNGIAAWPDQGTLVVADTQGAVVWAYRIEADGSLTHKQPYYFLQLDHENKASGADGMAVDTVGRLYVTSAAGLQMFDPTGRLGGVIAKPQRAWLANVCFGGPQLDTLFVTCTDKVYKRRIKARGVQYFEPTKK